MRGLIVYSFLVLVSLIFAYRVYLHIRFYDRNDISSGIVKAIKYDSSKNHTYSYYEIYGKDNNEYKESDQINYNINMGDKVTFRILHFSNSARILTVNGYKVNSYYGFADYFSIFYIVMIIIFVVYKYKKVELVP
jgi:hypothetical protein